MEPTVLLLFVLVLSIFLGIELISKVPSTLHTPLMSGANAISGITIVGAILVILAFTPFGAPFAAVLLPAGLALMGMGIAELMAPDPATDNQEENKEGYLFQGAEQSIPEGNPVPVLYGELRVPGQAVSFNLRNSSEGFLSGTSNAGTMATTTDSEGNLFLVPAFSEV